MDTIQITVDLNGNHIRTQDYSTDTHITIGRGDENVLILESSSVSRNHCVLKYIDGQWILDDLASTNGVQLDGKRVSNEAVRNKSIISIRPFQLLITLPELESQKLDTSTDDSDSTIIEDSTIVDSTIVDFHHDEEEPTLVGATLGGGNASHSEKSKQDFILVQSGLSAGTSVPLFKKNIIGRTNSCDLVLTDDGIEAKHVEIVLKGSSYTFSNITPQSVIRLNGKDVSSGTLKDGDVLQLGQVVLCLRLETKNSLMNNFSHINKRVAALSILLIIMVVGTIGILSKGDNNKSENGNSQVVDQGLEVEKPTPGAPTSDPKRDDGENEKMSNSDNLLVKKEEMSLAQKRDFDLLMNEAKKYMDNGDYRKAANRCKSALGVAPGNASAQLLLEQSQTKLREEKDLVAQKAKLSEQYRADALSKISKIDDLIKSGDLMSAQEAMSELEKQNQEFPKLAEIQRKTKKLRNILTKEQTRYQVNIESRKVSFEKQLEALRLTYDAAEQAYYAEKYSEAKELWLTVANTHLNIPEKKQAAANIRTLDKVVREKVQLSYKKAKKAIGKKDYPKAVIYLSQILEMDAQHSQAKNDFDRLYPVQVKKAEHAYRTGLVFEGISRMDKAITQWRKATTILPLVDSKYYILARKRLEEHGVR